MLVLMRTGVGTRIRELRLRRGLKQGQLAAYANVTRGWLSLVESGEIESPGGERLDRVAVQLGVSSRYLLTGRDEPEDEDAKQAWLNRLRRFPVSLLEQLDRIGDVLFFKDVPNAEPGDDSSEPGDHEEEPDDSDLEAPDG